jgi:hypothetical protein
VRMGKIEKNHNMVQPYFDVFKGREIRQVVCGDYHVLFLVGGVLGGKKAMKCGGWGRITWDKLQELSTKPSTINLD